MVALHWLRWWGQLEALDVNVVLCERDQSKVAASQLGIPQWMETHMKPSPNFIITHNVVLLVSKDYMEAAAVPKSGVSKELRYAADIMISKDRYVIMMLFTLFTS